MSNDPPSYPPAGPPPGGYGGQPPGGYQPPPGGYQPPPGGYQQQPPPPGGYQQQPPPGGYQQGPYQQPAYGTPYGAPAGFGAPPVRPTKKWYQRWWVWLVGVIAIGIIAIVVVAFTNRNQYALESKLKSVIKDNGHTISNVHCPSGINTDKGHSYNCTATVDGQSATLHVVFVTDRHFVVTEQ
jgi:hypothetical protein